MIKTFIEFLYPGIFVSESSAQEIDHKDPKKVVIPKNCFGFRFYDCEIVKSKKYPNETLVGRAKNHSGWFYINSEILTLKEVEKKMPEATILISNMKINKWKKIVNTSFGQSLQLRAGDTILKRSDIRISEILRKLGYEAR